jgi:hypothetical protein
MADIDWFVSTKNYTSGLERSDQLYTAKGSQGMGLNDYYFGNQSPYLDMSVWN